MLIYLVIINILCLIIFGYDKKQAIKKRSRIPEASLLLLSFIGGGIGSFIGMIIFHHKTKKIKFIILIPVSVVITFLLIIQSF